MRRLAWPLAVLAVLAVLLWTRRGGEHGAGGSTTGTTAGTPPVPVEPASGGAQGSGREPSATETRTVAVAGRVVDVDGVPFGDLLLALKSSGETHETHTGPDGTFTFADLARAGATLDLSAAFDPSEPLGQRTLACRVDALVLDLSNAPRRLDVGTQVLPRSRPCWIEGQVVLDETWARSKELWLGDVRVDLQVPGPDDLIEDPGPTIRPLPGAPPDWRSPPWRAELPPFPTIDSLGHFRFAVETPHDPFLLNARVKRFEPALAVVTPTPDGVVSLVLNLPVE